MHKLENKISNYNKQIAIILGALTYHLSPEIIKYISEQNKNDFSFFKDLFKDRIDFKHYLFEGSDCVFPGVRRYISGKGAKRKYNPEYRAIVDDNTFPRYIWCFLINGNGYSGNNWKKTKLDEFELAHIFSHKESEMNVEKQSFNKIDETICPYGEFSSAANVILLPKGTIRPTDNSAVIKSIFYKRYIDLYGESTLNGRSGFKENSIPEWYPEIEWNKPFLPNDWQRNIDKLLEYRKERIAGILKN